VIVISDTSPITNLAAVGKLDLLRTLFDTVLIPPAVLAELEGYVSLPPWVEIHAVGDRSVVMRLHAVQPLIRLEELFRRSPQGSRQKTRQPWA